MGPDATATRRMKRPSPILLVVLLLIVVFKLAAQPLTRVAACGALLAIACVIIARVLRSTRARHPAAWLRITVAAWLIAGALVAILPIAMLGARPALRATYTPDQFATSPAITDQRGFYRSETDPAGNRYAWTQERATLIFDFLVHKPVTVTFQVRSAAVAGGPDTPVFVVVNGQDVGELHPDPKNASFQSFPLTFVPYDWGGQQSEIKLVPQQSFKPAKGDPRTLGVMVESITIDKSVAWSTVARRIWLLWAFPVCAALALGLAWAARRYRSAPAGYGAIAASLLGLGGAAALIALVSSVGFIEPRTYFVWLVGSLVAGICFAVCALALPFGMPDAASLSQRARTRLNQSGLDRLVAQINVKRAALSSPRLTADQPAATSRLIARDLALLFVIALGVRCIWAVAVPPWQAPDEPDHYLYAAHIANQRSIPHPPYSGYPAYPTEITTSWTLTLFGEISQLGGPGQPKLSHLPVNYDYAAARSYEAPLQDRFSDGGGRRTGDPPLYFLLEAIPYWLFRNAPIVARLFALRCGSAVLGALSCLFAYLLAYEIRRQRTWGWALGLCIAFMPMYAFISATVNNDVGANFFAAALTWLTVRAWRQRTLSLPLALALGVMSGLALLAKATVLGVLIVAGVVVLVKVIPVLRASGRAIRARIAPLGAYSAGVIALYAPWTLARYHYFGSLQLLSVPVTALARLLSGATSVAASPPQDANAVAQGLPTTLLAATRYSFSDYLLHEKNLGWSHFQTLFFTNFWGNFGWLDVPLAARVFIPIMVVYIIGGVGIILQCTLQRERRGMLLLLIGMVVAQIAFLFIGVDWFTTFRQTGMEFGLQGRYLFPVLAPLLFLLLSGWDHLCAEHPVALRVAPIAMGALQLIALATIFFHYYGVEIG